MAMTCAVCDTDLDLWLDVGQSPLANRYPASPDEQEVFYPLRLGKCDECTLVQMLDPVPDSEIYNDDYGFYSGGSAAQRDYHARGARLLLDRFGPRPTVEVACNDGSLLRHFADAGVPALGIDPAPGPVSVARAQGLDVIQAPLTAQLARQVRDDWGPAGLVVAYNSMAHVADLADVLTAVRTLIDPGGLAVFEVAYLPDMIAGNMYDQCYHEHRYFYSLTSLSYACRVYGLHVVDAELIELQNGGLRVTVAPKMDVASPSVARIAASERWLDTFTGFQGLVNRTRDHLLDLLAAEQAKGHRIGGYAAAAKATTVLNFCGLGPDVVEFVADETPYKQGRYIPGVKIPIVAEAPEADVMLLLAVNYLGTVLRTHPHKGRWAVPQPVPVLL